MRFEYLYVGLPALDAIEYLHRENWLGWALAALMKIPKEQVAFLGAEALKRIKDAPLSDQKRFLLGECVEAYLPLDDEQKREFEVLVGSEKYAGVRAMNQTTFEKGIEKGRCQMLRIVMEERFGSLPPAILDRIQNMTEQELIELGKAVVRADSLDDLRLNK